MPDDDKPRRAESWVVGSWRKPVLLTLVALGAALGTMHKYRDLGSLLAAAVLGLFIVHVWRVWRSARSIRPQGRSSE